MVLVLSLFVIIAVSAVVGRVCARSRPGERHSSAGSAWPEALDGSVAVTDGPGHHHGGFHGHTSTHDAGGWGGDSGGGWGGDSGGWGGDAGGGGSSG